MALRTQQRSHETAPLNWEIGGSETGISAARAIEYPVKSEAEKRG